MNLRLLFLLTPIFFIIPYAMHQQSLIRPLSAEEIRTEKTCELHHVPLQRGVVPIQYGMMSWAPKYSKARFTQFPNAASVAMGGCVVQKYTRAEVLFCDKCRAAEQTWLYQNPTENTEAPGLQ